jgi:hypothetical protein
VFFKAWNNNKKPLFFQHCKSRDSSVDIMTGYELDGRGYIPGKDKRFFSSPQCPSRVWSPPSLLYNGYRWRFPRQPGGPIRLHDMVLNSFSIFHNYMSFKYVRYISHNLFSSLITFLEFIIFHAKSPLFCFYIETFNASSLSDFPPYFNFVIILYIQSFPGGKVNILGGRSIGRCKQKILYVHVPLSERFPG